MAREAVVLHEEEDLATAMLKLPIPFNELNQLPIDSVYGFVDDLKEIIEDPNFVLKDSRELEDPNYTYNESIEDSNSNRSKLMGNSSNPPTVTRISSIVPKRSKNKRGRPKKQSFKSASSLVGSKVDITNKSCSHCGSTKTPLWREGPRGAGTLCNACGMQYKKGRLLPEYRPASSPDFKPNVHSNFHRKVMEIRRERILTSNSLGYQGFQH